MPLFYDQINRAVEITALPQRIISIVPSQTELLFHLGLNERIAGVTKFCIHPAEKGNRVVNIGGTKQLNMEAIHSLQPDLIIANKEENEQSQVEELMKRYPVWVSDIHNLPTAMDMITGIGELTGTATKAGTLVETIGKRFSELQPSQIKLRVMYLIWRKPYMAAGRGTFIDSMLQLCGFENVATQERYPQINASEIAGLKPDVVLLSSEPYPFGQKHIDEFKQMVPNAKVQLVDGEMFSWYGSRLLLSPAYFSVLIDKLIANK